MVQGDAVLHARAKGGLAGVSAGNCVWTKKTGAAQAKIVKKEKGEVVHHLTDRFWCEQAKAEGFQFTSPFLKPRCRIWEIVGFPGHGCGLEEPIANESLENESTPHGTAGAFLTSRTFSYEFAGGKERRNSLGPWER